MTKRLVLVVLAIVLGWLYMLAVPTVIGHMASISIPSWWNPLFSSRTYAALTWMILIHTLAVFAASLPFALLIVRLYGRSGVWVALAITAAISVSMHDWTLFGNYGHDPLRLRLTTIFDAVKLIGFLPALVWLFDALPSNNRIERPRER